MTKPVRLFLPLLVVLLLGSSCSSSSDNEHTTVTNQVPPPPHQALTVVPLAGKPSISTDMDPTADPNQPLLFFALPEGSKFRVGEAVPINFLVRNARLKDNGGQFRVRYIVDDEEMKWVDRDEPFALQGWVPGEHTVRMELVGPDGWPYRNGNANIVTRKILVTQ